MIINKKNKGFTLLLSLIVIGIILSVGLGTYEIVSREIRISSVGRESQIAFYSANAGADCAFYWEVTADAFSSPSVAFNCAGNGPFSSGTTEFDLNLGETGNERCAKVTVDTSKLVSDDLIEINSLGYNTSCSSKSSIKVERAVRITLKKTSS